MKNLIKKFESGVAPKAEFVFPVFGTNYVVNKQFKGKHKGILNFPDKEFKFDEGRLILNDQAGVVFEEQKSKQQYIINDFAEITSAEVLDS